MQIRIKEQEEYKVQVWEKRYRTVEVAHDVLALIEKPHPKCVEIYKKGTYCQYNWQVALICTGPDRYQILSRSRDFSIIDPNASNLYRKHAWYGNSEPDYSKEKGENLVVVQTNSWLDTGNGGLVAFYRNFYAGALKPNSRRIIKIELPKKLLDEVKLCIITNKL